MNWIEAFTIELPVAGPLVGLFVLGVCVGGLLNLGIYGLAWHARPISPWSAPPSEGPPRRWSDRLPVVGWLGLRRESAIHGRAFWIRPMLAELLLGVGFAALYWWEIDRLGLILPGVPRPSTVVLHATCCAHLVLVSLMLVASLIDCDEKIIPDAIAVPGTLVALLAAAICPWSLLPDTFRQVNLGMLGNLLGPPAAPPAYDFLRLTSPNPWPNWLDGFPRAWPLLIGLACWWLWCLALTHRTWYARHGWLRALELMCARLRREPSTWRILQMGLVGSVVVLVVWFADGDSWAGLLSALAGMAASGGIIWAIRIVGSAVLRREAMGFGDVTLMAMIGAFLGWQPCLIIFFLAPFAGLVVGLVSLILRRGPEIPYGPFLCMATLGVIVGWAGVWEWSSPIFGLGSLLIPVVLICLVVMVPLLVLSRVLIRLVRTLLGG